VVESEPDRLRSHPLNRTCIFFVVLFDLPVYVLPTGNVARAQAFGDRQVSFVPAVGNTEAA